MDVTHEDRAAITEVLHLHGHLCDAGELDRLDEVFTPDVVHDLSGLGRPPLRGVAACARAARELGAGNPVGHHVTNVVLTALGDGLVGARSKGIGVGADGTCASVTYEDTLVRGADGWRIRRRAVVPRGVPLGG
ncbi:nuclear transport factor 2 family protein [Actinomadura spongiicola]|uniref:Nuclear transport factor 2 family protein n=1 Tax=Actinomadura spongiicola TaxID=2303421 RepID=A0A372GEU2_9ACTN|nr:nuclear transport factor 2 family protein [Actinomadura spongiicola]RFS83885.1 nuclear transport factor 2 family protein [Actinomadura spongiicola]